MGPDNNDIFKRMLAGGLIQPDDAQMSAVWDVVGRTIKLSSTLNASTVLDQIRERLSEITGSQIDISTRIFVPFYTNFGKHIQIGKRVFINHACSFLDLGGITIEDDVLIGPKVNLITENHPLDPSKRKSLEWDQFLLKRTRGLAQGQRYCQE